MIWSEGTYSQSWNKTWDRLEGNINLTTKIIFENILKHLSFSNKSLLELGCGTGRISFLASKEGASKVTLVDSSQRALEHAKNLFKGSTDKVDFIHEDIFKLELDENYDIVLSSGLVEHFKGDRFLDVINLHKKFSKDKVVTIVPASPHYNNIRCKKRYTKELFGWQKPRSKKEMRDTFRKLNIEIKINRRFYPLYGINVRGKRYINRLITPFDNLIGGLLLTIGVV